MAGGDGIHRHTCIPGIHNIVSPTAYTLDMFTTQGNPIAHKPRERKTTHSAPDSVSLAYSPCSERIHGKHDTSCDLGLTKDLGEALLPFRSVLDKALSGCMGANDMYGLLSVCGEAVP